MRDYLVAPLGLVTQPNKVSQTREGAMIRADGLRMRDPGELQPFKTNTQWAPGSGPTTQYLQKLFSTGQQLIGWKSPIPPAGVFRVYWSAAGSSNEAASAPVSYGNLQCFNGRIVPVLFRGRTIFNDQRGAMVFDYVNPSSAAERSYRWAGLVPPRVYARVDTSTAGVSINPGKAVTIAAVIRRKFADGYEVVSAPSNFARVRNYDAAIRNIVIEVQFPSSTYVLDGDIIDFYRSPEADAPAAGLDIDPGTKVYQVASRTLTLGTTAFAQVVTAAANTIVGDALYTNAYTLQSAKNIPPVSRCVSSFKGYMFYANSTTPAQWRAQFPNGLGLLGAAATDPIRQFGVGTRKFLTGTFTSGNPTITGISADEMVGVEVGQYLWDGDVRIPAAFPAAGNVYPSDPRILSKTATTITMSANAKSSGAPSPSFLVVDAVEISGSVVPFSDVAGLLVALGFISGDYALISDTTTAYRDGSNVASVGTTFGQGIALQPARQSVNNGVITVRGTSGNNYMPPIPALTSSVQTFSPERRPNYVHWSWEQQPEAVPPGNYEPVGSGEHDAVVTTRDAQWFWSSDGLWRWTGYGTLPSGIQANWRVDLIDKTIRLAGPGAICAMGEKIFAYTNQGFVRVSDSAGLEYLSRGVIGDLIPGAAWSETPIYTMAADPVLNEVWLNIATPSLNVGDRMLTIVWNELYGIFTVLNQRVGDDNINYVTSLAFHEPTGVIMLGLTNFTVASGVIDFHDPASNAYAGWTADFQPIYGGDPLASKQWQDITAIFDPASTTKPITPRFNEISGGYTNPLVQFPNTKDARVSFGVPITAPAIGALIACGISGAAATGPTKFRGLSPRFTIFSDQQLVR